LTDLRKAAQAALDYLDTPSTQLHPAGTQYRIINALRAALAQPQGEPVAWIQPDHLAKARVAPHFSRVEPTQRFDDFVPLYLAAGVVGTARNRNHAIRTAIHYHRKGEAMSDLYNAALKAVDSLQYAADLLGTTAFNKEINALRSALDNTNCEPLNSDQIAKVLGFAPEEDRAVDQHYLRIVRAVEAAHGIGKEDKP